MRIYQKSMQKTWKVKASFYQVLIIPCIADDLSKLNEVIAEYTKRCRDGQYTKYGTLRSKINEDAEMIDIECIMHEAKYSAKRMLEIEQEIGAALNECTVVLKRNP